MTKAMISSPVNKEEEKEIEEEEEEKVEEEDKIRTTMQSSVAMPQSCIHGPKQLFLSSKLGSGGGEDHSYNASSIVLQQSCNCQPRQLFSFQ